MNSVSLEPVRIYSNITETPEKVFDAWLDPKSIAKWMFAPSNDKIVSISTKGFPDTEFSFVVEREGKKINHHGSYIEVRRPHRLVFTWGVEGYPIGDSRVAIDFEPNEGATYLTLTHRGVDAEYKERTTNGWTRILNSLQEALAPSKPH